MFEGSIDFVDRLLLAWSFVSLVFFSYFFHLSKYRDLKDLNIMLADLLTLFEYACKSC